MSVISVTIHNYGSCYERHVCLCLHYCFHKR